MDLQQLLKASKCYSRCKTCDIKKALGGGYHPPSLVARRLRHFYVNLQCCNYVVFKRFCVFNCRVARCPVFNRTVGYFGSLSGIKMIVIPDNACVISSIFSATDRPTGTVSVWYFGQDHMATLTVE